MDLELVAAGVGGVAVIVGVSLWVSRRGERAEGREPRERGGREPGERRGHEPLDHHDVDERRREALERSGLVEVLERMQFVRESPTRARWRRGDVELTVGFRDRRVPQPAVVDRCDIRIVGGDGESLGFAHDFVGRATRPRAGDALVPTVDVEHPTEGARKLAASDADRDRFRALLERHADVLRSVQCSSLELYNHRVPKLHVYVTAPDDGSGELFSRAVDCAEAMFRELRG